MSKKSIVFIIEKFSNFSYMVQPYLDFFDDEYTFYIFHNNSLYCKSCPPPIKNENIIFIDFLQIKNSELVSFFKKKNIDVVVQFAFQSLRDTIIRYLAKSAGIPVIFMEHGILAKNVSGKITKSAKNVHSFIKYFYYFLRIIKIGFLEKKAELLKISYQVFLKKRYYKLPFDNYILYSQYSQEVVSDFFGNISGKIVFSGYPIYKNEEEKSQIESLNVENSVVYIQSPFIQYNLTKITADEEKIFYNKIYQAVNKLGYSLKIILHPNVNKRDYEVFFDKSANVQFYQNDNNTQIIKRAKFVIGQHSTLNFAAVVLQKPIIFLEYPETKISVDIFDDISIRTNIDNLKKIFSDNAVIESKIQLYNNFIDRYIGTNNTFQHRVKSILKSIKAVTSEKNKTLIEKYCLKDGLATYDPYDIWKTKLGFWVKRGFNKNKSAFLLPAAAMTIFDTFINNKARLFYKKQEYPIVRAFAALSLLNLYQKEGQKKHLEYAKKHIDWLINNHSKNLNGIGWGIMFNYPVKASVVYDKNAALTTITPYALEAIHEYYQITKDNYLLPVINKIYDFFVKDVKTIEESDNHLITSYGTFKDRAVVNAVSYSMYSMALLTGYVTNEKKEILLSKIKKMYNFIISAQQQDGSWLYDYYEKNTFIDCFHSAFVLKNLIKTNEKATLPDSEKIINRGFNYILKNFYDEKYGLFKRFALSNKPSLIKFDLYDNAEMLNLFLLMNQYQKAIDLNKAIQKHFFKNRAIYSATDIFNRKINKDTLRWAVMPYIYALSKLNLLKE